MKKTSQLQGNIFYFRWLKILGVVGNFELKPFPNVGDFELKYYPKG